MDGSVMNSGNESNLTDADVVALAQQYLDGALTPEQQATLLGQLRRDGRTQTLFVRSLMQAAYLNEVLAQQRSAGTDADGSDAMQARGGPATDVPAPPLSAPIDLPEQGDSSAAPGWAQMRDWLTGWGGFGLVTVMLVAVASVLLLGREGDDLLATRPSASPEDAGPAGRAVAVEVFDPRSIRLAEGSARVTLPKVGYMLVDGPADVDLLAPLHAKLNRGRIRVRVTEPSGRGFVVETPDGEVVDLSTEFGLAVSEGKKTDVVVFDGAVDLRLSKTSGNAGRVQRLTQGEGVAFNKDGEVERVVSIVTGNVATFLSEDEATATRQNGVIVKVSDNLRSEETKRFYEIVPAGLGEDALAYVDRPGHEWNGLDKKGMPEFLLGADYIKTFSDDKTRPNRTIRVRLGCPAMLYVIYDGWLKPPEWLEKDFRDTGKIVGMDLSPWPTIQRTVERGVGPGNRIDHSFRIWQREVKEPGVVTLGGNGTHDIRTNRRSTIPYMYGIAAVALKPAKPLDAQAAKQEPRVSSN